MSIPRIKQKFHDVTNTAPRHVVRRQPAIDRTSCTHSLLPSPLLLFYLFYVKSLFQLPAASKADIQTFLIPHARFARLYLVQFISFYACCNVNRNATIVYLIMSLDGLLIEVLVTAGMWPQAGLTCAYRIKLTSADFSFLFVIFFFFFFFTPFISFHFILFRQTI